MTKTPISRRSLLKAAPLAGLSIAGLMAAAGTAFADQPHMQKALEALGAAEGELNIAEHDKGGHRVKALKLVHDAIAQVKMGIAYDRRH